MSKNQEIKELSLDELEQVNGGIVTEAGADWLTRKIKDGKAAGSSKENIAFLARYSSGKGALAQTTPEEAASFVLLNWDKI